MSEAAGSRFAQADENLDKNLKYKPGQQPVPLPAAHGVKQLNEQMQGFANRLAGLFRDLSVKLLRDLPEQLARATFCDGEGLYFQPLSNAAGIVSANKDDLDGLVDILKNSEEIIRLFENRTGIGFEPVELLKQTMPETIWLEISLVSNSDQENSVTKARFGFCPALQNCDNLAEPQDVPALFNAPVPTKITLRGPSLNMLDAFDLAKGDMVLLAREDCDAILSYDDEFNGKAKSADGRLNLLTGQFHSTFPQISVDQGEAPVTEQNTDQDMSDSGREFSVPVKITMPEISVPADKLAAIKEGTTLDIGPLSIGLQVDLNVGGRSIGNGEIVKIGDSFAVLIDHISGGNKASLSQQEIPHPDIAPEEEQPAQMEQN